MTVLILTSEEDVTADLVVTQLTAQGTPLFRVDPEHFPGRVDLTARVTAGGGVVGHIAAYGRRLPLHEVRSVWRRRPGPPGQGATVQAEWVALESERALYGALRATTARWMNHPDAIAQSRYKVWQLETARRAGLRVPDTLFTTVPEDAAAFAASAGPLIVKSVSGRHPEDPPVTLPTCRVEAGADFAGVAASATCLQAEVAKVRDLRLTVVGDRMFPCYIEPRGGELDWRFLPAEECSWTIGEIPEEVRAGARRYMAAAGLVYAALDFAVDAHGTCWFLEANQGGQFGFVELATGAPISQAIAEWLGHPPSAEARGCLR